MEFDWKSLVDVARWLSANAPEGCSEESLRRTVLGRTYYAAFGHARVYAERYLGFVRRGGTEDHGRLRAHLRQRRRQAIAERLDRLREWRNRADYDDVFSPGRPTLEETVPLALGHADYVVAGLPPPATPSDS